ncbi:MAG: hypothetical protein JSS53_00485 [Proteobacteria bacterium]|nr:hypothetical protein [Pseudomonadota bacterium]
MAPSSQAANPIFLHHVPIEAQYPSKTDNTQSALAASYKKFQKSYVPTITIINTPDPWEALFDKTILPPELRQLQSSNPAFYAQYVGSIISGRTDLFQFIESNNLSFPLIVGFSIKLDPTHTITCHIEISDNTISTKISHFNCPETLLTTFKNNLQKILESRINNKTIRFTCLSINTQLPSELSDLSTFLHPILLDRILNKNFDFQTIDLDQIQQFIKKQIEEIKTSSENIKQSRPLMLQLYAFLIKTEEYSLKKTLEKEPHNNEELVAHYQNLSTYFFHSEQYITAVEYLEKAIELQRGIEEERYNQNQTNIPEQILKLWRVKKAFEIQTKFISSLDTSLLEKDNNYFGSPYPDLLQLIRDKIKREKPVSNQPISSLVINKNALDKKRLWINTCFNECRSHNGDTSFQALIKKEPIQSSLNDLLRREFPDANITPDTIQSLLTSTPEKSLRTLFLDFLTATDKASQSQTPRSAQSQTPRSTDSNQADKDTSINQKLEKIQASFVNILLKQHEAELIQALISRGNEILTEELAAFFKKKYPENSIPKNDIVKFLQTIDSSSLFPKIESFLHHVNSNKVVKPFALKALTQELESFIYESLLTQKKTETLQAHIIQTLKDSYKHATGIGATTTAAKAATGTKATTDTEVITATRVITAAQNLIVSKLVQLLSASLPNAEEHKELFVLARDIALMTPQMAKNDPHPTLLTYLKAATKPNSSGTPSVKEKSQNTKKTSPLKTRDLILKALTIQKLLNARASHSHYKLQDLLRRYSNFLPYACERFTTLVQLRKTLGFNAEPAPYNPNPPEHASAAQLEFHTVFSSLLINDPFNVVPLRKQLSDITKSCPVKIKNLATPLLKHLIDPQRLLLPSEKDPEPNKTNALGKQQTSLVLEPIKPAVPVLEKPQYKNFQILLKELEAFKSAVKITQIQERETLLKIIANLHSLYDTFANEHFTALEGKRRQLEVPPMHVSYGPFDSNVNPDRAQEVLPLNSDGEVQKTVKDGKNTVNYVKGDGANPGVYLKTDPDNQAKNAAIYELTKNIPGILPFITVLIRLTNPNNNKLSYTTTASGEKKGVRLDILLSWQKTQKALIDAAKTFQQVTTPKLKRENRCKLFGLIEENQKKIQITDSMLSSLKSELCTNEDLTLKDILYIIREISSIKFDLLLCVLTGYSMSECKEKFNLDLLFLETKNSFRYFILYELGLFLKELVERKKLSLLDLESLLITATSQDPTFLYKDINDALEKIFPGKENVPYFENPYSNANTTITVLDALIQIQTTLDPTLENWVTSENFSALVLAVALSIPNDQKSDNMIACLEKHGLVDIDPEVAMANLISALENSDGQITFKMELRSIVLFMQKAMQRPIASSTHKYLQNLNPAISSLDFLMTLHAIINEYEALGGVDGWGKERPPFLPFKFIPNMVTALYRNKIIAQHLTRTHSIITNAELMYYMHPIVILYYICFWKKPSGNIVEDLSNISASNASSIESSSNIMENLSKIYASDAPSIEIQLKSSLNEKLPNGLTIHEELMKYRAFSFYDDPADRTQTITEAISELLEEFDYQLLPTETVHLILQRIFQLPFIQKLEFRHCLQLGKKFHNDPHTPIHQLAINLKQLINITLLYCDLSFADLCDLVTNRPNLELTISDDGILTLAEWIKLANFTNSLTIVLKNGTPIVFKKSSSKSAEENDFPTSNPVFAVLKNSPSVDALKFLAALGAKFTGVDSRKNTVLHLLTQKDYVDAHPPEIIAAVVKYLLTHHLADPDEFNKADRTPLMQSVTTPNINVTKLLVDHGALPGLITPEGNSVLHIAADLGNASALQVMIESMLFKGLKIEIIQPSENTALLQITINATLTVNTEQGLESKTLPMSGTIPINFESLPGIITTSTNKDTLYIIMEGQEIPTPPIRIALSHILPKVILNIPAKLQAVLRVPQPSKIKTEDLPINSLRCNILYLLSLYQKRNAAGLQLIHTGTNYLDVVTTLHHLGVCIDPPLAVTHPGGETPAHLAAERGNGPVLEYLLQNTEYLELLLSFKTSANLTIRTIISDPDLLVVIPQPELAASTNLRLSIALNPGQKPMVIPSVPQRMDVTPIGPILAPLSFPTRNRTMSVFNSQGKNALTPFELLTVTEKNISFELLTVTEKNIFDNLKEQLRKYLANSDFHSAAEICWVGARYFNLKNSLACETTYRYFAHQLVLIENEFCNGQKFSHQQRPKTAVKDNSSLMQFRQQLLERISLKSSRNFIEGIQSLVASLITRCMRKDIVDTLIPPYQILIFNLTLPYEPVEIGIIFPTSKTNSPKENPYEKLLRYFLLKIAITFGEHPFILSVGNITLAFTHLGLCTNKTIVTVPLDDETSLIMSEPHQFRELPLIARLPAACTAHGVVGNHADAFKNPLQWVSDPILLKKRLGNDFFEQLIRRSILNFELDLSQPKKIPLFDLNSSFYSFLQLIIYLWGLQSDIGYSGTLTTILRLQKDSKTTPLSISLTSTAQTLLKTAEDLIKANKKNQGQNESTLEKAVLFQKTAKILTDYSKTLSEALFTELEFSINALHQLKIRVQLIEKSGAIFVYHENLPQKFNRYKYRFDSSHDIYRLSPSDFKNLKKIIRTIILLYLHFSTDFQSFNLDTDKEITVEYLEAHMRHLQKSWEFFIFQSFDNAEQWISTFNQTRVSIYPNASSTSQFQRLNGLILMQGDPLKATEAFALASINPFETGFNDYLSAITCIKHGKLLAALEHLKKSETALKQIAPFFTLHIELARLEIYCILGERQNIFEAARSIKQLLNHSGSDLINTKPNNHTPDISKLKLLARSTILQRSNSGINSNLAESSSIYFSPAEKILADHQLAVSSYQYGLGMRSLLDSSNVLEDLSTNIMYQITHHYETSYAYLKSALNKNSEDFIKAVQHIDTALAIAESHFVYQHPQHLKLLKFKAKIHFSILNDSSKATDLFKEIYPLFKTLILMQKIATSLENPHFEILARIQLFILSVNYNSVFKEKMTPSNQTLLSSRDYVIPNLLKANKETNFFKASIFHLSETATILNALKYRYTALEENSKSQKRPLIPYTLMTKIYLHLAICDEKQSIFYLQNAYIIFQTLAQQAWLLAHQKFLPGNRTWVSPHEFYIRKTIQYLRSIIEIRQRINSPIDRTLLTLRYMAILAIYIRDFDLAEKIYQELHLIEDTQKYKVGSKQRHKNSYLQDIELARLEFYKLELGFLPNTDGLSYVMSGSIGMPVDLLQELEKNSALKNQILMPYTRSNLFELLSAIQSNLGTGKSSVFKTHFSVTTDTRSKAENKGNWNEAYLSLKQRYATACAILNENHPVFKVNNGKIPIGISNTLESLFQNMGNSSRFMVWIYVLIHSMLEKELIVPLNIPTSTISVPTLASAHKARHLLFAPPYVAANSSNPPPSNYQAAATENSVTIRFDSNLDFSSTNPDQSLSNARMTWLRELTSGTTAKVIASPDFQAFTVTFEQSGLLQTNILQFLQALHSAKEDSPVFAATGPSTP